MLVALESWVVFPGVVRARGGGRRTAGSRDAEGGMLVAQLWRRARLWLHDGDRSLVEGLGAELCPIGEYSCSSCGVPSDWIGRRA